MPIVQIIVVLLVLALVWWLFNTYVLPRVPEPFKTIIICSSRALRVSVAPFPDWGCGAAQLEHTTDVRTRWKIFTVSAYQPYHS